MLYYLKLLFLLLVLAFSYAQTSNEFCGPDQFRRLNTLAEVIYRRSKKCDSRVNWRLAQRYIILSRKTSNSCRPTEIVCTAHLDPYGLVVRVMSVGRKKFRCSVESLTKLVNGQLVNGGNRCIANTMGLGVLDFKMEENP